MSVLTVPALTNAQLRAAPVPVSVTTLPLPTGAATAALQPTINADGGSQVHIMNPVATQAISAVALPLPTLAATSTIQATINTAVQTLATNSPVLVSGTLPISINNTTTSANLSTLSSVVSIIAGSLATIGIQVSGTGVGFSLTPQASQDGGTTYINVGVMMAGAGSTSTPVTAITTNGNWKFSTGSYTNFRLLNTIAASSGTVTANLSATNALDVVRVSGVGDQADSYATWYTQIGSLVSHLKLLIAITVGAGSHTYGYTSGNLTTDAWTLLGTTRTKTYTYTGTLLTAESDWV